MRAVAGAARQVLGLAVLLPLSALSGCSTGSDESRLGERLNVLVVTLDTLRADRLAPYGFTDIETPALSRLADEGVLFENAHSTTPLTLPAHTSMFTGQYPLRHGVIDNGGYVVPEDAQLLAETLSEAGYRTGGFVAAYVLDRRWQIDQGFDEYFDDFDVRGQRVIAMGGVQRPANEVVDRAVAWLDEGIREGGEGEPEPFFLWAHFYDPHAPYEPPEPYRSRYPGRPYLGEVAFTDAQIGRLLSALEERDLLGSTLIVVVGDHGESLGDHGEAQHGFFIYEEATHVPFIVRAPGGHGAGVRRAEPVSIIDLTPTVLDAVGIMPSTDFHGRSLLPLFDPDHEPAARYVYSESWYARLHYGWSELQSLRDDRYKLIVSSEPELYDLMDDPGETVNRLEDLNTVLFRMNQAVTEQFAVWSEGASASGATDIDEETRRKLVSLGYVGSFQSLDGDGSDLPSPRSKIGIYNKSQEARQAMNTDDTERAEGLLLEVLAEDPGILDAHQTLGELYFDQGRLEEAVAAYRAAIPLKPDDPYAYIFGVDALVGLSRLPEAEQMARDGLEFVGDNAQLYFLLGDVVRRQGKYDEAMAAFERCLELNPDGSSARGGIAQVLLVRGELDAAEQYANEALELNPILPGVHAVRAEVHDARGNGPAAVREYLAELEIQPNDLASNFNLAMVYRKQGREDDEERLLAKVLELDPDYPLANLFMARLIMRRGGDATSALRMVEGAVEQDLEIADRTLAYFLLADLHNRMGDPAAAQQWLNRARQLQAQQDGL